MGKTRRHWTEATVTAEILALRDAGQVPSAKQIAKLRPALFGGAQRVFGGWRKALIAAGIDPEPIADANRRQGNARRTKWTRAAIITTLRARLDAGMALDVTALRSDRMGSLLTAAKRTFGSYEQAVEAADIAYEEVRLTVRDWSPESVIEAIHALDLSGSELNVSAAQHAQGSLVTAAIKQFGSWDQALKAAGFDPTNIRLDVNTESGKGRIFENLCDALFAVLRPEWQLNFRYDTDAGPLFPDAYDPTSGEWIDFKLAAWGMSVNTSIRKYAPFATRLRFVTLQGERESSAKITFQSVFDYEAETSSPEAREIIDTMRQLEANQVPPTRLAIWSRVWTREKVLDFVRGLPEDAQNSHHCQTKFRREYSAAVRIFGGWSEALEAAGIDSTAAKLRRDPYTRSDVDTFIRDRLARGDRLDAADVTSTPSGSGLYQASQRLYGDWPSALRANGVNPDSVDGYWLSKQATLERLGEFIRKRHRAGDHLNAQFIRDNFKAEYGNAQRLAGGWRGAIELAGIPYETVSSTVPPQAVTKEQIDRYIRNRFEEGLPLTVTAVRKDNRPILTAIYRHHYRNWRAALEANGIAYRAPRVSKR